MILNKAQAEAVRDAICALNNVGMVADIYPAAGSAGTVFAVYVEDDGTLLVGSLSASDEHYPDFDAFVKAYGLVP